MFSGVKTATSQSVAFPRCPPQYISHLRGSPELAGHGPVAFRTQPVRDLLQGQPLRPQDLYIAADKPVALDSSGGAGPYPGVTSCRS